MTSQERAYLAGFFDGEGNVGAARSHVKEKTHYAPILQTVQKDRVHLERELASLPPGPERARISELLRVKPR